MIGENFIRINRHDNHLEKMKNDLLTLRHKWSQEYHKQDEEGNYIYNVFVVSKKYLKGR